MSMNPPSVHSLKYDKWIGYTQARRELGPAFKSSWPYTLLGLLIGLLLFLLEHHLKPHYVPDDFGVRLLEHLGVGFWVSSIAVFFYEWGAHIKKTMELSEELVKVLTVKAQDALEESLLIMLGKDSQILREKLAQLVNDIGMLQQQPTWVGNGYVGVVEWLLDEVVLQNVQAFGKLKEGALETFAVPPNAAEMADQILAAQMRVMKSKDSYDVISDITSWRNDGLEVFKEASSAAMVKEGVRVRRIFNLFHLDLPEVDNPLYEESCKEAISILEDHFEYAGIYKNTNTGGKYEVRIFGLDESNKLKGRESRLKEKLKRAHFGLFRQNKAPKSIICFQVEESDLSDMLLSLGARATKSNVRLFDTMWKAARSLAEDSIKDIINNLDLSDEQKNRFIKEFETRQLAIRNKSLA